jgi:hypothetical protein
LLVDDGALPPQIRDGAIEVSAVEQANASRHENERRCSVRLALVAAIAEPTEPMERDRARQCLTGLTLVEHAGRVGAQALVLDPVQIVDRALNAPDRTSRAPPCTTRKLA